MQFYHPIRTKLCEVKKFELSLQPDRFGGGIGRHAGLKIPWAAMPVRVRFPSEAHESLLEEILRGIFVFMCTSLAQTRYIFAEEGSGAKVEDLNGTMRKKKTKEGLKYAVCESCGQHSQGYCKDKERLIIPFSF